MTITLILTSVLILVLVVTFAFASVIIGTLRITHTQAQILLISLKGEHLVLKLLSRWCRRVVPYGDLHVYRGTDCDFGLGL